MKTCRHHEIHQGEYVKRHSITRHRGYKPNSICSVRWEWKQILFIKWGYKRKLINIIPKHINCRCQVLPAKDFERLYMGSWLPPDRCSVVDIKGEFCPNVAVITVKANKEALPFCQKCYDNYIKGAYRHAMNSNHQQPLYPIASRVPCTLPHHHGKPEEL